MLSRFVNYTLVLAVIAVSPMALGASNDYKAGQSDVVKSWPGRDFEGARSAGMPLLVYFHDTDTRRNDYAKFLETKVLASAELKDAQKAFLSLKIKQDGTDYKGWPTAWLAKAKNGGAIMLSSSDMSQIIFYEKSMPKEAITPQELMARMAAIVSYEARKKEQGGGAVAIKKEEAKGPMAPENDKKPLLPGLVDPDKKAEAKPAAKKKPVAAPTDE